MDLSGQLGNSVDPDLVARQLAHQRKVEKRLIEVQLAERQQILAWAAIMCSCARRYTPGEPSWAGCIVHGQFTLRPDGTVL